jgi:hypothetical protein
MNTYEIITPSGPLDTYGDIDISLNYAIDDIFDISKRNTSWSKTITLPGTPINNKFFKHLYDVNIDNISFNIVKRIDVSIRIGTNDVMSGYMQLMNIVILNGEIQYEISIAGSLKSIISTISDYDLGAIDLSEYNHRRTPQNIVSSWDYNIYKFSAITSVGNPGDGYVYPYIINGNSQDIWSNAYTYDMFPAIYVQTIFKKIMEIAGFTYSSKFLESDYFKKLIIPFVGDKLQLTEEEVESRTVRVGVGSTIGVNMTPYMQNGGDWYYNWMSNYLFPLNRESGTVTDVTGELVFTDKENQWNGVNYYTCAHAGYYDVSFVGKLIAEYKKTNGGNVEWKKNSLEYRYFMELVRANGTQTTLYDSGSLKITPSDGTPHPTPWKDTANPLQCSMGAENVFMEAGDKIRMIIGHRHPAGVNWAGGDSKIISRLYFDDVTEGEFTKLVVKPSTNELYDTSFINMNQILDSKIKMKDFFLDIVKMFNLIISDDPNTPYNVIIEPRDDFFKSRERVLNWDEEKKLDLDSEIIITPMSELDAQSYKFTYTEDSDFYNEEYKNETNRVYGDYEYKIDNDFSDKTNELKIGFSPTPNSSQFIDSKVAPFFVTYDGDKLKPKKVKQRILFYGGSINLKQGSTLTIKEYPTDPTFLTVNKYPYCGMWDHPTKPQWDLSFGRTQKIYWNSSNVFPNQNLFERFHKQTLLNIIDNNAKLLECTVHLTPKDIANFDFRDIIFLMGSYWRINKIKDYNPVQTDRLTKVVLYKIIDLNIISKYLVEVPTSNKSCPVDMVSKKTPQGYVVVSPSGKEVNTDCCKQVGGTFVNGMCFLKIVIPPIEKDGFKRVPLSKSSIEVIPTIEERGPLVLNRYLTSRNAVSIESFGSQNYIQPGSKEGLIIGSNSSILNGIENAVIIGDGITADENGSVFIGAVKINKEGNILHNGLLIIDGGLNEVFNYAKTNPIEVVDGTFDSVRNPGGSSYSRPIIDGGQKS